MKVGITVEYRDHPSILLDSAMILESIVEQDEEESLLSNVSSDQYFASKLDLDKNSRCDTSLMFQQDLAFSDEIEV